MLSSNIGSVNKKNSRLIPVRNQTGVSYAPENRQLTVDKWFRSLSLLSQGFSGFSFLLVCSKSAQNYGKNSLFFGKNKAISGILAYSNRKNQFFSPSAEISAHLLPKFTDSGSAIPLTIAFAEDSFEV